MVPLVLEEQSFNKLRLRRCRHTEPETRSMAECRSERTLIVFSDRSWLSWPSLPVHGEALTHHLTSQLQATCHWHLHPCLARSSCTIASIRSAMPHYVLDVQGGVQT